MKRVAHLLLLTAALGLIVSGCGKKPPSEPGAAMSSIPAEICGEEAVMNLIAGRHDTIGTVTVANDDEYLYVEYKTTGGWLLYATHLHVATSLDDIPQTKKGCPIPGQFRFKHEDLGGVEEDTFMISLEENGWEPGDILYIAAHAEVKLVDEFGRVIQEETAWGEGPEFPGCPGWAMYFTYEVQPCNEICGGKFYDTNKNGDWDSDEPGIEGWLIELLDESGSNVLDSKITDNEGYYCFFDLVAGTYVVREELRAGWEPTTATEQTVTVEEGQYVTGIDFGNVLEGIEPGDFTTYTQGGWGTECHGQNPGCYRDANFDACFPTGLTVGCDDGYMADFTSSSAIEAFLPAGGTPAAFTQNHEDPTTPPGTEAGVLAGQVVALTLNVEFDLYDPDFGASDTNLKDLIVIDPESPFEGWTVEEVLDEANTVLGGCDSQYTPAQVNEAATAINENFVDGEVVGTFLGLP